MDCRVKPGNDGGERINFTRSRTKKMDRKAVPVLPHRPLHAAGVTKFAAVNPSTYSLPSVSNGIARVFLLMDRGAIHPLDQLGAATTRYRVFR
jgi:hypothetical protein